MEEDREGVILEEGEGAILGNVRSRRLKNPRRRQGKEARLLKVKPMISGIRLRLLLKGLGNKEQMKTRELCKRKKVTIHQSLLKPRRNLLLLTKTRLLVTFVAFSTTLLEIAGRCCVKSMDTTTILLMTV